VTSTRRQKKAANRKSMSQKQQTRKSNGDVLLLPIGAPAENDSLSIAVHSAIDVERETFDLAVLFARPVFDIVGPVVEFVLGSPQAWGVNGRRLGTRRVSTATEPGTTARADSNHILAA
jgi:hypothetical protein